jgi:hypothetical protein
MHYDDDDDDDDDNGDDDDENSSLAQLSVKVAVFWVVAPCRLAEVCRRFKTCLLPPSSKRSKF